MSRSKGKVFWFTGLSGAGKSTLGRLFHARLRRSGSRAVYLDGDELREVFGFTAGHSIEERRRLAMSYARLCRLLAGQGADVVCATISMFHSVRDWNRANIPGYREIYVRVPLKVLAGRDSKKIYSRALSGKLKNVMGVDLAFEEPRTPDLVIDNDGTLPAAKAAALAWRKFFGKPGGPGRGRKK